MHEIVTIQIGRQANFVGTHFWNAQESYHTFGADEVSPVNHDIHFRQGQGPDGQDTYLPRALIYDLRGGFGSLARVNALGAEVEEVDENSAWNGALNRIQNPSIEPSPYLKSLVANQPPVFPTTATTRYFSDFASTFYHPRSLIPVSPAHPVLDPSSQVATNDLPSFNTYVDGYSLFETINTQHDIFDRDLRLWIEECDTLQAIQVIASADDAWAGFTSAYVEDIRDQLGKGSVWVWGLDGLEQKEQNAATRRTKTLNHAAAVANITSQASLYIPLSLPPTLTDSVSVDRSVLWHTSALVSSALDSITLPARLRHGDGRRVPVLSDWEDALNDNGRRKLAEVGMEVGQAGSSSQLMSNGNSSMTNGGQTDARIADPNPLLEDEEAEQDVANTSLPINMFQSTAAAVRPAQSLRSRTFARLDVLRGHSWQEPFPAASLAQEHDLRFLRRGRTIIESYRVNSPLLPLVPTFPHIFTQAPGPCQTNVPGLELRCCLRTSSGIATWIRGLESVVRGMPPSLLGDVVGDAERESLRHELGNLAETYIEGWDSADESEDDDE